MTANYRFAKRGYSQGKDAILAKCVVQSAQERVWIKLVLEHMAAPDTVKTVRECVCVEIGHNGTDSVGLAQEGSRASVVDRGDVLAGIHETNGMRSISGSDIKDRFEGKIIQEFLDRLVSQDKMGEFSPQDWRQMACSPDLVEVVESPCYPACYSSHIMPALC